MDAATRETARKLTEELKARNTKDPKTDPIQAPAPTKPKNQDNVGKVDYLR
jgi:hypothetical protein